MVSGQARPEIVGLTVYELKWIAVGQTKQLHHQKKTIFIRTVRYAFCHSHFQLLLKRITVSFDIVPSQ